MQPVHPSRYGPQSSLPPFGARLAQPLFTPHSRVWLSLLLVRGAGFATPSRPKPGCRESRASFARSPRQSRIQSPPSLRTMRSNPSLHRLATAGFARFRERVNSNVRPTRTRRIGCCFEPPPRKHRSRFSFGLEVRTVLCVRGSPVNPQPSCVAPCLVVVRVPCHHRAQGEPLVVFEATRRPSVRLAALSRGRGVAHLPRLWQSPPMSPARRNAAPGRHAPARPNPSLQPTRYGWLRQPPRAAELKR
jgi:hypothetical protein